MRAERKRKMKGFALLGVLCMMFAVLLFIVKFNMVDSTLVNEYDLPEDYVYWSGCSLIEKDNIYTYDESIEGYSGGIAETKNYYCYKDKTFPKKDVEYVNTEYYVSREHKVYTHEGYLVKDIEYADYVFSDGVSPGYIVGDSLFTLTQDKSIYLGGNIIQLVETEDNLYILNDYNSEEGKGAIIVYNKAEAKIDELIEVDAKERIQQVLQQYIYTKNETNGYRYAFATRSREELENVENVTYFSECRVKWENNCMEFLYLDKDVQIGKKEVAYSIDGVSF